MFKFLIYLFIFYAVTRFIFGTLLNFKQSYNAPTTKFDNEDDRNDVKVNKQDTNKNKRSSSKDSNIGEYVDFEEIK
jgi:hypothetical protein